jgi:hypothetical protein
MRRRRHTSRAPTAATTATDPPFQTRISGFERVPGAAGSP